MGLTRPRAYQIYDIDYKQSVRALAISNVTLAGGAPSQVDGINLNANDRILVIGQSNAVQNGIYYVTTLGTGSNGTWTRTIDGNETGEMEAGMIIMVTEGAVYADTSWKLITNDPIIIGISELVFEQNTGVAFGNIVANGTPVTSNSASGTFTLAAGNNVSITGNNTSKTITISASGGGGGGSGTAIVNGASNVDIATANADITVSVAGTANVAVFGTSGLTVTGNIIPTANITYDLGTSTNRWRDLWLSNSTIYLGSATISAEGDTIVLPTGTTIGGDAVVVETNGSSEFTANVTAGNLISQGILSATGNITGNYIIGNGSQLIGLPAGYTDANVVSLLSSFGSNVISTTGNISSGNLAGTLTTAAQPNVTSVGTLGSLAVTGNITGGNLLTSGIMSVTGNITGNYFIGNGSQLTGLPASYGDSNVATFLASYGSNTISTTGNITGGYILGNGSQLTGITGGSSATNGIFVNTSNVSANYTIAAGTNGMSVGPITVNNGVVATVANGQRWVIL